MFLFELLDRVLDEDVVEVCSATVGVTIGCLDFDVVAVNLDNGSVNAASTHIEHENGRVFFIFWHLSCVDE